MSPGPGETAALYFEDFEVGTRWESARRTVTEADISAFAGVSGDFNPLHTDEVSASAGAYGGRIAHGALVLSIATGLRQQMGIFAGTHRGLLEIRSWRFLGPVRPGDTIDTVTTVSEMRLTSKGDAGVVVQGVEVRNQRGEVVQAGELVTLIAARGRA
jgi:acyl dehydratase